MRENVGWLVEEGKAYLKLVWDRRSPSKTTSEAKERDAGIVLVKHLVLEVQEIRG